MNQFKMIDFGSSADQNPENPVQENIANEPKNKEIVFIPHHNFWDVDVAANSIAISKATKFFGNISRWPVHLLLGSSSKPAVNEECVEGLLKSITGTKLFITNLQLDLFWVAPSTTESFAQTLSKLPHLRHFSVAESKKNPVALKLVTPLLVGSRGLESFCCHDVTFDGDINEFKGFAAALEGHPELRFIHFSRCKTSRKLECIAPILIAIASIPNLTELEPSCWISSLEGQLSADVTGAVRRICSHPNLRILSLPHELESCAGFQATMQGLQNTNTIQVLSLCGGEDTCGVLAAFLRTNQTVQDVHLFLPSQQGSDEASIQESDEATIQDSHLVTILQALKDNSSLHTLRLSGMNEKQQYVPYKPSDEVRQAAVAVLENDNCTLTHLDCFGWKEGDEKIDYYLKLNQLERKPNGGKSKWA
jgi:hypothetical protein